MKFSYSLIKEMAPGLPVKEKFAEEFALKSFEIEKISGDMIDIKITANRWCDASSHEGMAREAAAVFGLRALPIKTIAFNKVREKLTLKVMKDSDCSRYIGVLVELRKKGATPLWMKKYLKTCGIQLINPVVDALNYVMIETGQPMHAFDAEKLEGNIIVRKAIKGEKITTIDGGEYCLENSDTVITDREKVLAIAGVKGGKGAEITNSTKMVILESANFNPTSVYRTSKRIKLETDASRRYGHGMSSIKAQKGMERALQLLSEICSIKIIAATDEYKVKEPKKFIKFDPARLKSITGVDISQNQAAIILKKLRFKMKGNIAEVPEERIDVAIFEDLVEEVIRIYGLNEIKAVSPVISIVPAHNDPIISFREKTKRAMMEIGFDEIISYSFGDYDDSAPEIINPISLEKSHMRTNLTQGLNEAIDKNQRFFGEIKIFEFGKVFDGVGREHWSMAAAVKTKKDEYPLRVLRGAVEAMLWKIGIAETQFILSGTKLILKIGKEQVGELSLSINGERAFFEASAEKLMQHSEGEFEYEPISPYPSIMRDISLWADDIIQVGELFEIMNAIDVANLNDVDLVDYYPDSQNARAGITLRLIFQSSEKTLTDTEVDVWMDKITTILSAKKGVVIR